MNKINVIKMLSDFVAIESVTTDQARSDQVLKAVEFLEKNLKEMGFEVKIIKQDKASPLVVAQKIISLGAKTIGIYGHYDVQPEDPIDQWQTKPFELTSQNGKFYGRGVADNKGHIIQNLVSVKHLIDTNTLKNNIVFIFEGEEEAGSTHFEELSKKAKNILAKADVFFVTDMGMHYKNKPQIFYGLRGNDYYQLTLTNGKHDLHSGVYGNRVHNPINVVADLIAKMKDIKTGRILIPHFYDQVKKIEKKELRLLEKVEKTDEEELKETKAHGLIFSNKDHPSLSPKIYPSLDVHGIIGGYTQKGEKTIIPKTVKIKFSVRLVPFQNCNKIDKLMEKFVQDNLPKEIRYDFKVLSQAEAFYTDINNTYIKKTSQILTDVFGHETLINRSGGSVNAAGLLQKLFKKPIVLIGFTLPDDRIHAPNENYDEEMFWKGIEVLKKIYSN